MTTHHDPPVPAIADQVAARLLHRRVLVLDGELTEEAGTRLSSQLMLLAAEDPHTDIALWINSPGGSVPAMLAIRDTMRLVACDVATLALGIACSAGQFLLSAGAPGKRHCLPHSRILLHQGSSGIGGTAVDIELQADDLRALRDTVLSLIAADTGQTVDRVFDDSLRDRWFTADQALAYGFVDVIAETQEAVMPEPSPWHAGAGFGGAR